MSRCAIRCRWICYRRVSLTRVPSVSPGVAPCATAITPEWPRRRSAGHGNAAYARHRFPVNKTAFTVGVSWSTAAAARSRGILHPSWVCGYGGRFAPRPQQWIKRQRRPAPDPPSPFSCPSAPIRLTPCLLPGLDDSRRPARPLPRSLLPRACLAPREAKITLFCPETGRTSPAAPGPLAACSAPGGCGRPPSVGGQARPLDMTRPSAFWDMTYASANAQLGRRDLGSGLPAAHRDWPGCITRSTRCRKPGR
jgi:hypothetical protein